VSTGRYRWRVTEFRGWRCPACKRVILAFRDRWDVRCANQEPPGPHPMARCVPIPDEEVDPLQLARACNLVPGSQYDP
jgi:hypothetical protein